MRRYQIELPDASLLLHPDRGVFSSAQLYWQTFPISYLSQQRKKTKRARLIASSFSGSLWKRLYFFVACNSEWWKNSIYGSEYLCHRPLLEEECFRWDLLSKRYRRSFRLMTVVYCSFGSLFSLFCFMGGNISLWYYTIFCVGNCHFVVLAVRCNFFTFVSNWEMRILSEVLLWIIVFWNDFSSNFS